VKKKSFRPGIHWYHFHTLISCVPGKFFRCKVFGLKYWVVDVAHFPVFPVHKRFMPSDCEKTSWNQNPPLGLGLGLTSDDCGEPKTSQRLNLRENYRGVLEGRWSKKKISGDAVELNYSLENFSLGFFFGLKHCGGNVEYFEREGLSTFFSFLCGNELQHCSCTELTTRLIISTDYYEAFWVYIFHRLILCTFYYWICFARFYTQCVDSKPWHEHIAKGLFSPFSMFA